MDSDTTKALYDISGEIEAIKARLVALETPTEKTRLDPLNDPTLWKPLE